MKKKMRIKLAIPLYLNEISAAINATNLYHTNIPIEYISTDSREITSSDLFIPLKGKRFNGEDYIEDCLKKGAVCITEKRRDNCLYVKNAENALLALANYYKIKLKKLKKTVAITGSVGKTTTKEMLKIICSQSFKTFATLENMNNTIGVPLSILSAPKDTEILILELGMNHLGEISKLSKCASPDIGVITNIGSAHIGNLGSRENIAAAKLEILDGMKKPRLVIPYDEHLLSEQKNALTFSTKSERADVYIYNNEGNIFLKTESVEADVNFAPRGDAALNCLCAAVAAAAEIGIPLHLIKSAISLISSDILRQRMILVDDLTILADYYNASFESIVSSIDLLNSYTEYKYRSILLGSVYELGDKSEEIHRNIGAYAAKARPHRLFIIGEYVNAILEGALSCGMKEENIFVNNSLSAPKTTAMQIAKNCTDGELILFKASHRADLGRIVECLKEICAERSLSQ